MVVSTIISGIAGLFVFRGMLIHKNNSNELKRRIEEAEKRRPKYFPPLKIENDSYDDYLHELSNEHNKSSDSEKAIELRKKHGVKYYTYAEKMLALAPNNGQNFIQFDEKHSYESGRFMIPDMLGGIECKDRFFKAFKEIIEKDGTKFVCDGTNNLFENCTDGLYKYTAAGTVYSKKVQLNETEFAPRTIFTNSKKLHKLLFGQFM